MGVYLGTATPTDFKLGATAVSKLYLGTTQVWPTGGGTPAPTDSYYNQVALLLHGESLTDSSRFNRTITANGGGTVSSVQKKYGTGSLYFPTGEADYYGYTGTGYFTANTTAEGMTVFGDFCLEWWQYMTSMAKLMYIADAGSSSPSGTRIFSIDWDNTGFRLALNQEISYGSHIKTNQWQYIALARSGSTARLYIDGALVGSLAEEAALVFPSSATQRVLGRGLLGHLAPSNAYIDDFRLTNGINRGFTGSTIPVPTAPFPDAQATGAFAVILTSGTSFTVPSGYTSMKAWAIGQGGTDGGALPGGAGGVAFKTWAVTGGSAVSYSVGNSYAAAGGNTTVTYGGNTITGNGAVSASTSLAGGSFSGGDGGANGGSGYWSGDDYYGGSVNGGTPSSGTAGTRRPATNVSGLFEAAALAGATATETGASARVGSGGWANEKEGTYIGAGYGGGRSTSATETPGAVVLSFS